MFREGLRIRFTKNSHVHIRTRKRARARAYIDHVPTNASCRKMGVIVRHDARCSCAAEGQEQQKVDTKNKDPNMEINGCRDAHNAQIVTATVTHR